MDVSIIIPCHNESDVISEKINNTLALGDDVKEVIIVDDHSTDKTYDISLKLAKKHGRIIVLKNPNIAGKNFAVKFGLAHVLNEVVCMTDADVMLPADVVRKIAPYLEKNNVGMVCLSTRIVSSNKNCGDSYYYLYETVIRIMKIIESELDSVTAPHGQALFFKKSLKIFPNRQADDVDLAIQTRKKGYAVKYARDCFF